MPKTTWAMRHQNNLGAQVVLYLVQVVQPGLTKTTCLSQSLLAAGCLLLVSTSPPHRLPPTSRAPHPGLAFARHRRDPAGGRQRQRLVVDSVHGNAFYLSPVLSHLASPLLTCLHPPPPPLLTSPPHTFRSASQRQFSSRVIGTRTL